MITRVEAVSPYQNPGSNPGAFVFDSVFNSEGDDEDVDLCIHLEHGWDFPMRAGSGDAVAYAFRSSVGPGRWTFR